MTASNMADGTRRTGGQKAAFRWLVVLPLGTAAWVLLFDPGILKSAPAHVSAASISLRASQN